MTTWVHNHEMTELEKWDMERRDWTIECELL